MSAYPENLHYTTTHEWARLENDNTVTIGITDHAQGQLGDLVYIELPKLQQKINANQEVAVVESVKTAADIYSPIDGEIIAVNEELRQAPEKVNKDPYGQGWIFRVKINDANELKKLLDAKAYKAKIGE